MVDFTEEGHSILEDKHMVAPGMDEVPIIGPLTVGDTLEVVDDGGQTISS